MARPAGPVSLATLSPEIHWMISAYLSIEDIQNVSLVAKNEGAIYQAVAIRKAVREGFMILEWATRTPALGHGLQNAVVHYLREGGGGVLAVGGKLTLTAVNKLQQLSFTTEIDAVLHGLITNKRLGRAKVDWVDVVAAHGRQDILAKVNWNGLLRLSTQALPKKGRLPLLKHLVEAGADPNLGIRLVDFQPFPPCPDHNVPHETIHLIHRAGQTPNLPHPFFQLAQNADLTNWPIGTYLKFGMMPYQTARWLPKELPDGFASAVKACLNYGMLKTSELQCMRGISHSQFDRVKGSLLYHLIQYYLEIKHLSNEAKTGSLLNSSPESSELMEAVRMLCCSGIQLDDICGIGRVDRSCQSACYSQGKNKAHYHDVRIKEFKQETVLMAATQGNMRAVVRELLALGADPNVVAPSPDGRTAVMTCRTVATLDDLLHHSADLNLGRGELANAIIGTIFFRSLNCWPILPPKAICFYYRYYVDASTVPGDCDSSIWTPGDGESAEWDSTRAIVEKMLAHPSMTPAMVNAANSFGATALHYACLFCRDLVGPLLRAGADPEVQFGVPPRINEAAWESSRHIYSKMHNARKYRPLWIAICAFNDDMVETLVRHGARRDLGQDSNGVRANGILGSSFIQGTRHQLTWDEMCKASNWLRGNQ